MGEYELVMPFVACKTQGGPYDDESFVAGYQAAQFGDALQHAPACMVACRQVAFHTLLPQLDLIAMRWGYRITVESADDTWAVMLVERIDDPEEDAPA